MTEYDETGEKKLRQLIRDNPQYSREAYEFVSEALGCAGQMFDKPGHVTGQELCEGVRRLAVDQFGYMARTVLESWGIRRTEDVGRIVYLMIEAELLRKSESDSIDDFRDVFDFREAFDDAFRIELRSPR